MHSIALGPSARFKTTAMQPRCTDAFTTTSLYGRNVKHHDLLRNSNGHDTWVSAIGGIKTQDKFPNVFAAEKAK